jgi:hypothetical protein
MGGFYLSFGSFSISTRGRVRFEIEKGTQRRRVEKGEIEVKDKENVVLLEKRIEYLLQVQREAERPLLICIEKAESIGLTDDDVLKLQKLVLPF